MTQDLIQLTESHASKPWSRLCFDRQLKPAAPPTGAEEWTMPISESHTHVTADQLQPHEDFAEMNAPGTEATSIRMWR